LAELREEMKGQEHTSRRWAEREVVLKVEKKTNPFFQFQNYIFREKNNLEIAR
jgi:hypothetical protein